MKKVLCLLLSLVMMTSLLSGCIFDIFDDSGDIHDPSGNAGKWTVLLYLCGTDLESDEEGGGAASYNLQEILEASLNKDVNFIIQTGGTSEWQNDFINPKKLQRWEISDGDMILVGEESLASMGDADTLASFLKWGTETYPADKYMVTFWNHGGGAVSGVAFDELFEDDSLTLNEIQEGVAAANTKFELIGFDTCLMATLENAAKLSDYGNYMVASEEYEPGGGWAYTDWLSYLAENPDCTGEQLGMQICDSYYNKCALSGEENMATLSVIDLSKVPDLNDAFTEMTEEMTGVTSNIQSLKNLTSGAKKAENYGGNNDDEGYTNMVDLGDLVNNTQNVLTQTSDEVMAALYQAVIYQVKGENRINANGISVFYPLSTDAELCDKYAEVSDNAAYLSFISALNENWDAPSWTTEDENYCEDAVTSEDYDIYYNTFIDENACFNINITSGLDAVESVYFSLYYYDEDNDEYYLMGVDDDIIADWDYGEFYDNFDGYWLTLGGMYCAPELIAEEDGYNIYSIPILLNGEQTNIRAIYDFNEGEYKILGVYDGISESGMSSRDIRQLKDGDKIVFLFDYLASDSYEFETVQMGEITYKSNMQLEETELEDGKYIYRYEINDIFGNVYYSEMAVMECEDGSIYVYEY